LRASSGFTLIELLVALALLGTVSAIAFGGLRTLLTARNHTNDLADRLGELQRGVGILQRDFEQVITRPQRDHMGDIQPAMQSEEGKKIVFTRTGYPNPAMQRRSAMQRVAYELREKTLYRKTWTVLDGATEEQEREVPLIHEVEELELAFLGYDDKWVNEWPMQTRDDTSVWLLPKAVSVTLDIAWAGKVTRLFRASGIRPTADQLGEMR
jgi:general secretion pathway protein J